MSTELRLPSLVIKNFRGLDHLTIPQLGRVNMVVGKNNSGKSSLLEAVSLYAAPIAIAGMLHARNEYEVMTGANGKDQIRLLFQHLFYGRNLGTFEVGPLSGSGLLRAKVQGSAPLVVPLRESPAAYLELTLEGSVTYHTVQSSWDKIPQERLTGKASARIPYATVPAGGLADQDVGLLWDEITLTDTEQTVVSALQVLAPDVERLSLVANGRTDRTMMVRLKGEKRPIPLRSMGDGMSRVLGITLSLVNASGGFLLIDEFENGLHYTVQTDLWRLILRVAAQLDVQVFASSHSWDAVEAFQQAAAEDGQNEGLLIRLERKQDHVRAITYSEAELRVATRDQIEVR